MKKYLRLFIISLAVFIMCVGMVGCNYNGHFFDKEHLETHFISDLPKPSVEIAEDKGSLVTFYMTEEQIEAYAEEVYNYIISCNFPRLGTRGMVKKYSMYFWGTEYFVRDCKDFDDFKQGGRGYIFVWAVDYETDDEGNIDWQPYYLHIEINGKTPDSDLHKIDMELRGERQGCEYYFVEEDDNYDGTKYKLTVNDTRGFVIEALEKVYRAGERVTVKTAVFTDVDLIVYLDGISLGRHNEVMEKGEYHWEFYFVMPAHDAVLSFELSGGM